MLQQLTCLIPTEDIDDDKPTKTSTSNYIETATWDDNSVTDSKTTKSWTSHTVVADYGSSTRHRRETEDSLSPITTKSTFKASHVDLTWQNVHKEKTILTTERLNLLENSTPTSIVGKVTKEQAHPVSIALVLVKQVITGVFELICFLRKFSLNKQQQNHQHQKIHPLLWCQAVP